MRTLLYNIMIKQLTTTAGKYNKPVYLYNDIYDYYVSKNININEIDSIIEKNWLNNNQLVVINQFSLEENNIDDSKSILKEIEDMKDLLDKIETDINLEYE